ncbi:MAG TPA: chemoreceptor glutamine deamidase CheD [Alphaproteobacteria bacterium]|nr:chemoreceptor glutamine deamidase CheD [Alphaproteobacteria bacterium]
MNEFTNNPPRKVPIRRTDTERVQVGDLYDGVRRYYDQNMELTVVKLMTGDCYFTVEPREMLVTILGSCISVCLRDPETKIGGMNHILLPGENNLKLQKGDPGYSTRFGAFAMEELINGMLKLGASKNRMEAKVFGGGNVIESSTAIGTKNINFAKDFLIQEKIPIVSEDVGGDTARRLHFFPETGKAMIRKLKRKEDLVILEKEREYQERIKSKFEVKPDPEVELF